MKRLAIITTHPIQYNAPWFRLLAAVTDLECRVFYTWHADESAKFDKGFGKQIAWDIPLLEGYDYQAVPSICAGNRQSFWSLNNPSLIRSISNWRADAILVIGWNYLSHIRAMYYFAGRIPVLFRGDSHLLYHSSSLRGAMRRALLHRIYRYVDRALYVGTHNKRYFETLGLQSGQLVLAPHAIDNKRFDDPTGIYERRALQLRNQLDIHNSEIVLLFAGKLQPVKRPTLLLDAFLRVASEQKQLRLVFVGNGELEGELRRVASGHQNVSFIPFQNQSEMPVIYRLGDVMILPSRIETWGLAVNEAMACSRPVIVSTKVGCGIDLVDSNRVGFTFEADSIDDFCAVLTQCADAIKLREMGKACREQICEFSFQRIVDAVCDSVREQNRASY